MFGVLEVVCKRHREEAAAAAAATAAEGGGAASASASAGGAAKRPRREALGESIAVYSALHKVTDDRCPCYRCPPYHTCHVLATKASPPRMRRASR